jgi:hypothetical protein
MMQRQPSVGNVLARTSSFGSSTGAPSGAPVTGVTRQGSQTSLFEQFACTAKELVRETTRQSSQDGLLAQMDKVRHLNLTLVGFQIMVILDVMPYGMVDRCQCFGGTYCMHLRVRVEAPCFSKTLVAFSHPTSQKTNCKGKSYVSCWYCSVLNTNFLKGFVFVKSYVERCIYIFLRNQTLNQNCTA